MRSLGANGVVAGWTALLLLAAQIAASGHFEAQHVRCPEHGEAIHVESARAGAPSETNDLRAGLDGDEHDLHCFQASVRSTSQQRVIPCEQLAPPLEGNGLAAGWAPAPIALLSLAPKSSPPPTA